MVGEEGEAGDPPLLSKPSSLGSSEGWNSSPSPRGSTTQPNGRKASAEIGTATSCVIVMLAAESNQFHKRREVEERASSVRREDVRERSEGEKKRRKKGEEIFLLLLCLT